MPLSKGERIGLARDITRMAGDLNGTAITLVSDLPIFAINDIKNLEAKAHALFELLKAEAAD